MKIYLVFLIVVISLIGFNSELLTKSDKVLELIIKDGYKGEVHKVLTEDGYFLRVHRVFANLEEEGITKKPVFLMHGILATAADFLLTGRNIALAYFLADHGYDVWLGNARGSRFSTKHQNLSKTSPEFWTFSWHEIGHYDLPVMIDCMLNVTESSKAFFVGHSQGTTALLVLLSTRPEYNKKLVQAHLLGPSAFRKKLPRLRSVSFGLKYLDSAEHLRYLDLSLLLKFEDKFSRILCREDNYLALKLCMKIISVFVGRDQKEVQIDTSILPNLMQFLSKRISIMQITHYYQNMVVDKFQMYDYKSKNPFYYNSLTPPEYNLKNVVTKTYLYHASQDLFTSIEGVQYLASSLPNVQKLRSIEDWNHIDFVYGKYAREILYRSILEAFDSSP